MTERFMRMGSVLVAAAILLSVGAVANAATTLWFSTPNVNGNGAGGPGGSADGDLKLTCTVTPGATGRRSPA